MVTLHGSCHSGVFNWFRSDTLINKTSEIVSLIEACSLCSYIDKPFLKFKVYIDWLPKNINTLVITESPPPGIKNNFFYNPSKWDFMRRVFKEILDMLNLNDLDFLKKFRDLGFFTTNAIKCRPVGKGKRIIERMRRNCIDKLAFELSVLKPRKIVAMGKTAFLSITQILHIPMQSFKSNLIREVNVGDIHILFTPHPNYIKRFKSYLTPVIRGKIL